MVIILKKVGFWRKISYFFIKKTQIL